MGKEVAVKEHLVSHSAAAAADESGVIAVQADKTGGNLQNFQFRVFAARANDALIIGDDGIFCDYDDTALGITLAHVDQSHTHLLGGKEQLFVGIG